MQTKQCLNCSRQWPLVNGKYNPVGNYHTTYCTSCGAPVDWVGHLRGWNAIKPFNVLALPLPPAGPFDAAGWLEDKQAREAADEVVLDKQIATMEVNKKLNQ